VVGVVLESERIRNEGSERRVIMGLIARNPFFRQKSLPDELRRSDIVPLSQVSETELILCSLRDWHDEGTTVDHYRLEGFEVTVGAVGGIIRPFGTWDRIVKGVRLTKK
jgi:hypothetical protein